MITILFYCTNGRLNLRIVVDPTTLNESALLRILETCQVESNYALLIRTLGEVYSSPDSLGRSFLRTGISPLDGFSPSQLATMRKEKVPATLLNTLY